MLKNSKNEKFPRAENVKIVEFRKTNKKKTTTCESARNQKSFGIFKKFRNINLRKVRKIRRKHERYELLRERPSHTWGNVKTESFRRTKKKKRATDKVGML